MTGFDGSVGDRGQDRERDVAWMAGALSLARRGLGQVWPNPAVGCLLVRDGRVVGRGWTQPGGRPHAETEALARAGALARGATAYVTLEPCSHTGKTPPCADALIDAGVARVVAAMGDPDLRVSGRGFARLRDAGIAVSVGLLEQDAREVNRGFLLHRRFGRPMVTLKSAASLDGRIATRTGHSQWITGAPARALGHMARVDHDAIAVGIGTALADDPLLTCRLPGLEDRSPVRVVFDSTLRLPVDGALAGSAREVPLWVICAPEADPLRKAALEAAGAVVLPVALSKAGGPPDIKAALLALGQRGLTRLLVEGGGRLAASFLDAGQVDRLLWFQAPMVIGGDGMAAVGSFGVDQLPRAAHFSCHGLRRVGADLAAEYAVQPDPLLSPHWVPDPAAPAG